ncbi:exported hypothetical protein [Capnocytophaga canimorsus]|uniref:Uncharacterized protein n=1 Tax=Capnocytophaga canimorsus TaxID=28188 RepID=A0A0B7IL53_9FLAO|nr:hypothetical protein [Capnocytophaga canimorsus]CEN52646.1 exported hypothetical protein [Capnocytophaga canimorsus]
MKKIILSLATVFAFGVVSAQDLVSSKGENLFTSRRRLVNWFQRR